MHMIQKVPTSLTIPCSILTLRHTGFILQVRFLRGVSIRSSKNDIDLNPHGSSNLLLPFSACRLLCISHVHIYPSQFTVPFSQIRIVKTSLFYNTLVCLPTGMGKTLISAVVMYNFYRWFPRGQVVFMAHTKPLLAQQLRACYDIAGVPESDTAEIQVSSRSVAWSKIRRQIPIRTVIFAKLTLSTCAMHHANPFPLPNRSRGRLLPGVTRRWCRRSPPLRVLSRVW